MAKGNKSKVKLILPTKKQVKRAQKSVWDFGNDILYKLCRENFEHKKVEHILTKVLFIGRIYAAAVERRKANRGIINDQFYLKIIAPLIKKSKLDKKLAKLRNNQGELKNENIAPLKTHFYLMRLLNEISGNDKRSFTSKYLHFHLPDMFFIFDNRAVNSLKKYKIKLSKELIEIIKIMKVDEDYAVFYFKCLVLKSRIKDKYGVNLTNRQIDNLLVEDANLRDSSKRKNTFLDG